MLNFLCRFCLVAIALGAFSISSYAASKVQPAASPTLYASLAHAAPQLNPQALKSALNAMQCAVGSGARQARHLAVIDYSRPSTERRLWIFDLRTKKLVLRDLVAHGQKSGENFATQFSNRLGSYQSSLGLFRTQESYEGSHGYSLRMDGLEPGFNDRARDRDIVIHAADYVNPLWSQRQGRIGRSQGCPAVRPQVARQVIDKLKDGQFMFSWYPDQRWLKTSPYLNCQPRQVASILSANGGGARPDAPAPALFAVAPHAGDGIPLPTWNATSPELHTMPSPHTLLLHQPGPRPAFYRVAEHLWGAGCNVDSDGDSRTADDDQWTELTLILRNSSQQRLDIEPLSLAPLVLLICASQAGLGQKAAQFIQSVAGGTLQAPIKDR